MSRRAALLRAILPALLLLLAAAPRAQAQSAGTANLLSAPGSWPTTGAVTGTTGMALDPLALYTNPAGLAAQDERTLLLDHGLLPFSTSWDLAAVSYPIPGLGAVGLGFARVGTSGIDSYDAANNPLGTIGYSETSVAAGVSRLLRGSLYGGATFKVLSQSLGGFSASTPALDLGLLARPAALRGGQIGISVQNVIAGSLDLGGSAPAVDRSFRLGLASPELRLGAGARARIALDLARQGSEGTMPRLAAEVSRPGLGAVRAGIEHGDPMVGLGLRWRRYGFDYAFVNGKAEATQQFAVRVAWGEPVSRYEERQRALFERSARDSLLAARGRRIAEDKARAEQSERAGDWEAALILWEVLHREDPAAATYGTRADRAREEIRAGAERAVTDEGARRLVGSLLGLASDALARGDLEEADGVLRGLQGSAAGRAGLYADTLAALQRAADSARGIAAAAAVARADSLRAAGRPLAAAEAAGYALRLEPGDPRAQAAWDAVEAGLARDASAAKTLGRRLEALQAVAEGSRAYAEGRYTDAQKAVGRALALDPGSDEAAAWQARIARRLSTPKPEVDARVRALYIQGMQAFTAGNYREALRNWEQILVLDPLNESARRNVLEARDRLKAEARR